MDLGLDEKDRQTLLTALSQTKEYEDTQNMMRAGVILCAQEMINEVEQSHLEQFNKDIPDNEDVEIALAMVNDYLIKRNLVKTSQVLTDEIPKEVFNKGNEAAEKMASKLRSYGNLLGTITAGATD
jgi:hypothetical protein